MRLTAVDIESRKLKRAVRGYCIRDVEDFRQEIIDNFEEMLIELAQLREQSEKQAAELAHYKNIEHNLNQSLILAQRAGDDVRSSAHHEAEVILRSAREEAQQVLREARHERSAIEREIADIGSHRDRFLDEFQTLLHSYMRRFEGVEPPRVAQGASAFTGIQEGPTAPSPIAPPPQMDHQLAATGTATPQAPDVSVYPEAYDESECDEAYDQPDPAIQAEYDAAYADEYDENEGAPAYDNVVTPPQWLMAASDE